MVEFITRDFNSSCLLAEYLVDNYSEDILEFWLDVELFKRMNDRQVMKDAAKTIHSTYIVPKASKEIIIEPLLKHRIMRIMQTSDLGVDNQLFDEVQGAIAMSLSSRCGSVQFNARRGSSYISFILYFFKI